MSSIKIEKNPFDVFQFGGDKQFMHVQLNPDNTAIKGTTGLPSAVWVVCCAFTIVVSVYHTSETKGKT